MDVILIGPGRAGRALCLRLAEAGHRVVSVVGRDAEATSRAAAELDADTAAFDGTELPTATIVIVAVRDDAIGEVAASLAGRVPDVEGVVHLSGLTPVRALAAVGDLPIGSFHPLQTLPTPGVGARRLEGAWVAVTTDDDYLADRLFALASSVGMRPFELADDVKALYHAASAAAANYPLAALAMAHRLYEEAGVPFEAAEPLVRAVVDNAFALGPAEALTGPIARSDVGTVRAQLGAVDAAAPDLVEHFTALARATADAAGTAEAFEDLLR